MNPLVVVVGIVIIGAYLLRETERARVRNPAELGRNVDVNTTTNGNQRGQASGEADAGPAPPTVNSAEFACGGRGVCSICYDHHSNILFLPCGHVCACESCAAHLEHHRCPMCNVAYHTKVKVHVN